MSLPQTAVHAHYEDAEPTRKESAGVKGMVSCYCSFFFKKLKEKKSGVDRLRNILQAPPFPGFGGPGEGKRCGLWGECFHIWSGNMIM